MPKHQASYWIDLTYNNWQVEAGKRLGNPWVYFHLVFPNLMLDTFLRYRTFCLPEKAAREETWEWHEQFKSLADICILLLLHRALSVTGGLACMCMTVAIATPLKDLQNGHVCRGHIKPVWKTKNPEVTWCPGGFWFSLPFSEALFQGSVLMNGCVADNQ